MDFSKVDKTILVRYQRRYNISCVDNAVDFIEKHFDNMQVNEYDVIAGFIYSVLQKGELAFSPSHLFVSCLYLCVAFCLERVWKLHL
jgi:hypothetical protein